MEWIQKVKNHYWIHLFVFAACVFITILTAWVPEKNVWTRSVDPKEKEAHPLDKKGQDMFHTSLAFMLLSIFMGTTFVYFHNEKIEKFISKPSEETVLVKTTHGRFRGVH